MKPLRDILRARGRALQSGPDVKHPQSLISQAFGSIGRRRAPLKTACSRPPTSRRSRSSSTSWAAWPSSVNRLGGDFRFQHLPVPFEVYADGIDLVIFEEFGSGAAALHLSEKIARDDLLRDPEYRAGFRKDYESKYGPRVWHRDFFDADIVECPDASVIGKSFGQVGVERGTPGQPGAPRRRVPRPRARARHRPALADHHLQPPPQGAAEDGAEPGRPDGLLRRRRAPAQHGVLQLRAAAAEARRDRREGRQAVPHRRAGRAPPHRRARRLVRPRRRSPARRRPRRPVRRSTRPTSTRRWRSTPRRRSRRTTASRGWSTATTPRSRW